MKASKKYLGLACWLLLCFSAGIFGTLFEPGVWYEMLEKPAWTPPNWIFPVVWPLLYICMGLAAWLIWKSAEFDKVQDPLTLFVVQLALNATWSWFFFGLQSISTALGNIIILWIFIVFTILAFRVYNKKAAWLLSPYLVWVTFAMALNLSIWYLN